MESNAQISGQLFQYGHELPLAEIYFKNSKERTQSDFNGNFRLQISGQIKNVDLILDLGEMQVEINGFGLDQSRLDLGKLVLPEFKSISIAEFDNLSDSEQESCREIYHWTQLVGYYDTNKLENNFLILNCKNRIIDFEFNPTKKTVTVDWSSMKACK